MFELVLSVRVRIARLLPSWHFPSLGVFGLGFPLRRMAGIETSQGHDDSVGNNK